MISFSIIDSMMNFHRDKAILFGVSSLKNVSGEIFSNDGTESLSINTNLITKRMRSNSILPIVRISFHILKTSMQFSGQYNK